MTQEKKKRTRTLVIALAILVLIVIGSTLAFFSSFDEVTNRFVGSRLDILLTETAWNPSNAKELLPGDEVEKNPQVTNNERTPAYIFLRVTVPCDAQMVDDSDGKPLGSLGTSIPMYKFMVEKINDATQEKVYEYNSNFSPEQLVNAWWKLVPAPEGSSFKNPELVNVGPEADPVRQLVYVYAYVNGENGEKLLPLMEGSTTQPLFDKLKLWNFNETFHPSNTSVRVEALGIQADLPGLGDSDITEVWQLLSEEVDG